MDSPTRIVLTAAAMIVLAANAASAQEMAGAHEEAGPAHLALSPDDLEWKPAPAVFPPGAQIAVLEGDPTKEGPFTVRLQLPAGYKIPPHTHPAIEHATVISGRMGVGVGETWDGERIRYSGPGGFFMMMPGVAHFAMFDEDTIVQIHAVGPSALDYVNPEAPPRPLEATTVKASKSNSDC